MRNLCSVLLILLISLGLALQTATAARFGGGRSFGVQRSIGSFSRPHATNSFFQQPAARPASTASKWLGPLAGLAAGGLLASLFMGHGAAGGILTWVVIGLLALFVIKYLMRGNQSQPISQPSSYWRNDNQVYDAPTSSMNNISSFSNYADTANSYPIGFDQGAFLRDAKSQFIRLQTAYDQKNLNDLRQFTTPEVFAEIQLQLHERGENANQTEVVTLNAELLDAITESQAMVASVRFTGSIREEANAPATMLNEIWHFRKELIDSHWMVAGIQQSSSFA